MLINNQPSLFSDVTDEIKPFRSSIRHDQQSWQINNIYAY
jgi:hypothetical protein